MSSLRRVRAGAFSIDMARKLDEIVSSPESCLLPVDTLFAAFPAVTADAVQERIIRCGGSFGFEAEDGDYRFYSSDGKFLMLGRITDGEAQTIKSFFEV
jgi:tRNA U55 pseudouridine synthase TruB